MRTIETCGQLTVAQRGIKGRSLDPENHSKQAWWRTRRNRGCRKGLRPNVSRAEFDDLYEGNLLRKSLSAYRGGQVLRSLLEAAAVFILAGKTAGGEL